MWATRAAICGLGGPSAGTPLGGVPITLVTSAWMVDSRSLTPVVSTGCTTPAISSVETWVQASLARLDTIAYAFFHRSPTLLSFGVGAAAPGGGGAAAAAVELVTSAAILAANAAGVTPVSTA